MKCSPLALALVTLVPSLVYAQNQQFSDCHTLQAAGNFIASDEALVNGLVCRVVKPKRNWTATTQDTGRKADGSSALLGIREPETLRSKEKKETNPAVADPTPAATSVAAQSNSAAGEQSQAVSFKSVPEKSLGEIARAYRKETSARMSAGPEQGSLELPKSSDAKVDSVAVAIAPQADKTPIAAAALQPAPVATAPVTSIAESQAAATKERKAASPTPLSSPLSDVARTAKIEVIAAPPASPVAQQASPETPKLIRDESAVKREANLPATAVESASAPGVQAPAQAAYHTSSPTTPSNELSATSAAPSATAVTAERRPELMSNAGSFAAPSRAATNPPAESDTNNYEEDAAFREGQAPTCRKNVSLGSMERDKLFLAIPDWALLWLEKNQRRFRGICFSDSLMPGARNYLVVFSMAATPAAGNKELKSVSASGEMASGKGVGSFTTGYGAMWHYKYERTVSTTITSASAEKAPHNQSLTLRYATAYSEQGIPVSHHLPGVTGPAKETSHKLGKKKDKSELSEFRPLEEMLGKMIEDIAKL